MMFDVDIDDCAIMLCWLVVVAIVEYDCDYDGVIVVVCCCY